MNGALASLRERGVLIIPPMVAARAAQGDRDECICIDTVSGKTVSGFQFG